MTFDEVTAAGAQIVHFVIRRLPTDGWSEISIDELRRIGEQAGKDAQEASDANLYHPAQTIYPASLTALKAAESGERVFTVQWKDDRAFAVTTPRRAQFNLEEVLREFRAEAEPGPDEVLEPIEIEVTTGGATADPTGLRSSLAQQPRKKWPAGRNR